MGFDGQGMESNKDGARWTKNVLGFSLPRLPAAILELFSLLSLLTTAGLCSDRLPVLVGNAMRFSRVDRTRCSRLHRRT